MDLDSHGRASLRCGSGFVLRAGLLLLPLAVVATVAMLASGVATARASSAAFGSLSGSSLTAFAPAVPLAETPSYQRPFKEVFGSAEQPSFESPSVLAVDPTTGDVLVGDSSAQTIARFKADGTWN
jgi:hypothetical protein